jgi:hypothetical protein
MWKPAFIHLEDVFAFLLQETAYHPNTGFSFCGITPGSNFAEAFQILGDPEIYNTESDQQQTAEYHALIDHPTHGQREHHQLNLLLWAFNQESISIVKLHFNYYHTGLDAEPFQMEFNAFLNALSGKLGTPMLKKLTSGKQVLSYKTGRSKLHLWNSPEGVRLEIK